MTIQDEINECELDARKIEAKIREAFEEHIKPLEDLKQKILQRRNELKDTEEIDAGSVDVNSLTEKYPYKTYIKTVEL
jgi:hypothetical protein